MKEQTGNVGDRMMGNVWKERNVEVNILIL